PACPTDRPHRGAVPRGGTAPRTRSRTVKRVPPSTVPTLLALVASPHERDMARHEPSTGRARIRCVRPILRARCRRSQGQGTAAAPPSLALTCGSTCSQLRQYLPRHLTTVERVTQKSDCERDAGHYSASRDHC